MRHLNKKLKKQLRKEINGLLRNTVVEANGPDHVRVASSDENFVLIGRGCSSAVFRSVRHPGVAVKIYSPEYRDEVFLETMAYKKTKGIGFFPVLFFYGRNFLALEFVEGKSLYECIIEGIEISEDIIEQVDEAIRLAREQGLVPSDVHFKNIIINDGQVKMIDLSDYLTAQHVSRWDRLKFFYKAVYKPLLKGTRMPEKLVDFTRKMLKYLERILD